MKLSLSALFVTLAVAQAAEQPQQNLRRELQTSVPINFNGPGCFDYDPLDTTWTTLPRNDDDEILVSMGISFPWLAGTENDVYISNNGHLSFDLSDTPIAPTTFFTTAFNIIAPYWGDVDTSGSVDGYVRWKSFPGDSFVVLWEEVANFGAVSDPSLRNTFQVVLHADGSICFCYNDMEWVRGTSTTSQNNEPVVGLVGAATDTFLIGSFDDTSTTFSYGGTGNGVGYLADKSFCFEGSSAIANPPTLSDLLTPLTFAPECFDYDPVDPDWNLLPRNDDNEYSFAMGMGFPWLAGTRNNVYVSNNGHLSFDLSNTANDARNFFTTDFNIIAPYYADVDTRGRRDGYVRWKSIPGDKFIVIWDLVAHYGAPRRRPPRNTFQAVLSSDGSICYCYGSRMEWTRGTFTSSTQEAVVGIVGAPTETFLIGSFNDLTTNFVYGGTGNGNGWLVDKAMCFAGSDAITDPPTLPEILNRHEVGPGGDPHITTWKGEHFEYHGQCDLTLAKDADFADGLGLDIQIRTKVVRFWSYIKNVAIKIGNDILEIEGSADADDAEAHYWVNYEYQGELETFAGFPVSQKLPSVYKRQYIIDLSSKYPGQELIVELYKEFVRVRFHGDNRAFANTVGLMGDFHTGETVARDGKTVMNDFTDFGDEWQVLPSEPKLFREVAKPQFPELCIKPEDPRGERKRRLAESNISIEDAEAACAKLNDPLSIKDCVYDILATQDLGMVGAF